MVARGSFEVKPRFAKAELVCWRCALKSPPRYKPGLQPPTSGQPGKQVAQRVWQNPVSGGKVGTQLDSSLRPVKKNSASTRGLSRSSQHVTLRVNLVRDLETASSSNLMPDIVTRRGSRLALGRHGRYYTTSVLRKTMSSVEAIRPVIGKFTLNNPPSAGQNVREHLQLWQQHLKQQMDPSGPFTANDIDHPQATYNNLQQGAAPNDQRIDGNEEDEDISSRDGINFRLRPGDIVALTGAEELVLAVFVRSLCAQSQYYTMTGRWVHMRKSHGWRFVVKQIIPPKDLEAIIPHLPQQEIPLDDLHKFHNEGIIVPREAGAKIIQTMLHFHNSTTQLIRAYAGRLNHIHDITAHPTKRSEVDLREMAMKVFEEESRDALTSSMLWAVHAAIFRSHCFRLMPPARRMHQRVEILSKAEEICFQNVIDWVREDQERHVTCSTGLPENAVTLHPRNPIPGFIKKGRALIHESRRTRDATHSGVTGPSRVRIEPSEPGDAVWKSSPSICFDEDEMKVIQLFHAWSTTQTLETQTWVLQSTASTILRALGTYKGYILDQVTGCLLLKELGMIPPWLDDSHYMKDVNLPYHGENPLTDELHVQALNSVAGFQMKDSMKDMRRDLGDLTVFCIDEAGAHEIDDGLSLEQVDERTFWVHIHVANPTAFLAPSSAIARNAAHRMSSAYFSTGSFPMLPEEISQPNFSMADNRPCITFSAKMTLGGDVTDTQISHGIVHNVRYVTPDEVQRELGGGAEPELPISLTVGGRMPAMPTKIKYTPMSSSDKKLLCRLDELAQAYKRRLLRAGGLDQPSLSVEPVSRVYLGSKGNGQTKSHLHERMARRFDGDPIISLRLNPYSSAQVKPWLPGNDTVSALMIFAGEIGAMWCSSRNIPIPYRGHFRFDSPDHPGSAEQFKQKYIDPLTAKQETIPKYMLYYYQSLLGEVITSPVPLRHGQLGIAAYSKITSPLRRFSDLLAHWQIEAAIRHESRTGKSLVGNTDESYLVYSRPELEFLVESVDAGHTAIRKAQMKSNSIWAHQFLFRAYHYNEAPLPELFNVVVFRQSVKGEYLCWSEELGFKFRTNQESALEGTVKVGDVWEVKITSIDCFKLKCMVERIRLVERLDDVMEGPWNLPSKSV